MFRERSLQDSRFASMICMILDGISMMCYVVPGLVSCSSIEESAICATYCRGD